MAFPSRFTKIYRKCMAANYELGHETTWCSLTNANIEDFVAPAFTNTEPPCVCTVKHKGYRPKILLLMMEEHFYILVQLQHSDRNARIILQFELLLLVESRCQKKRRGGSSIVCCTCGSTAEHLPDCSTTLLERLTWAIYDGVLSPGLMLHLEDSKSWGNVIKYLADKVFKGLRTHCPTCMSAEFKKEEQTEWLEGNRQLCSVVTVSPGSNRGGEVSPSGTTADPPHRDTHGSYRTHNLPTCATSPPRGSRSPECREQMGGQEDLHPMCDVLKWMKEHQCSYTDDQLDFWSLLQLLTNGS